MSEFLTYKFLYISPQYLLIRYESMKKILGLAIETEESNTGNSGEVKIYPPIVNMKKFKGGVRYGKNYTKITW